MGNFQSTENYNRRMKNGNKCKKRMVQNHSFPFFRANIFLEKYLEIFIKKLTFVFSDSDSFTFAKKEGCK